MKKVYLYKKFERFWHWGQTILVLTLIFTGFEIHGTTSFIGFEQAVKVHDIAAWAFLILIVFAIFNSPPILGAASPAPFRARRAIYYVFIP